MAKNSSAAAVELASPGGLHHVPTLHERRLGGLSGASHPGSGRLRGSAAAPVHLGALEGKKRGMEWHRIAILYIVAPSYLGKIMATHEGF